MRSAVARESSEHAADIRIDAGGGGAEGRPQRVARDRPCRDVDDDRFELAETAVAAGADYVAFGSFHASIVKPRARRADASLLTRAKSLGVPVVAIGGITAENARALFAAGADAVAVISAVFDPAEARDIEAAARAIDSVFRAAHVGG